MSRFCSVVKTFSMTLTLMSGMAFSDLDSWWVLLTTRVSETNS